MLKRLKLENLSRRQTLYIVAALAIFVAYHGVPVAFLKASVRDHLESKYGVHVDVGSVRVSVRGLVVTGVSAVWPRRNATMALKEMLLGFSPIKSLTRRKIVMERLKFIYPAVTVRLPEGPPERSVVSESSDTVPPIIPATFDLTVRRGSIHIMRGGRSVLINPIDAEISRDGPGQMELWIKAAGPTFGDLEFFYEEGRSFKLDANPVNLGILTDIARTPQTLDGRLFAHILRPEDAPQRLDGDIRLENLIWTGPDPSAMVVSETVAFAETETVEMADVGSESETPTLGAPEVASGQIRDTDPADVGDIGTWGVGDTDPETRPEIQFIFPSLNAHIRWKGRWNHPQVSFDEASVTVGGVTVQASGTIDAGTGRLPAVNLDFYAPDFDEPALENLSRHFHVLRYLHKFLETIESPSRLQAKLHLTGPLNLPKDWRYEGLIDIRKDTFAYQPFLGQYSFLGTVEFNEHGVKIPEILMPFGDQSLVLSGTAADYATRTARLTLKGKSLAIGPMLHFYVPNVMKLEDTSPELTPAGMAHIDLALTRFGPVWGLNGSIDLKQISIPNRLTVSPVQSYGRMTFSGDRGDGTIRVRAGSFETALNPYARALFTPESEYGCYIKQNDIRLEKLAREVRQDPRPVPFMPLAGTGDVSIKISAASPRAPRDTPDERRGLLWWMEGTAGVKNGRFFIPPFVSPIDSAYGRLLFETGTLRLLDGMGTLAGTPFAVNGERNPWSEEHGRWTFRFQTPHLDLADLIKSIQPQRHQEAAKPFEVLAAVDAGKLGYHGFEIPGVSGTFKITPGHLLVMVDTPIRSRYEVAGKTDMSFVADRPYPLKRLFKPGAGMGGDISGTVVLRGNQIATSKNISGGMDLAFDRLSFKKAAPLLSLLEFTNLSLIEGIEFEPFRFESRVENGAVRVDFDRSSNVGLWKIRGRLGLNAAFMPLAVTDSAFHVTFFPRENILTRILSESKILNLFGGKREGIKLDFALVGNYNNANILWTEEPFVSVIRGRVSELIPGFFSAPSHPDTEKRKIDSPPPSPPSSPAP